MNGQERRVTPKKYIHDLMRMYPIRFSELSRLPIPMAWKGRTSTRSTRAVRNAGKVIAKAAYMRYNGCKSTKERVCFA